MKDSNIKIVRNILPLKECHEANNPCVPLNNMQRQSVELFKNAVSSGDIKFEAVPCLCGSLEFDLIAKYDRYSIPQNTVMCTRCGLVLSNPRMTEKEYARFYATDLYRDCYDSTDYTDRKIKKYETKRQDIFDAILKVKELAQIKSVLEFGAGGGWNLIPFKEKGVSCVGYDHSLKLVRVGREYGLDMRRGGIADITGKYDVIILSHVVEHFTDPIGYLRKIKEHLNPDGILYIAVPDIKRFNMGQFQNAHTFYFTLQTLRYYMSQVGLSIVHYGPSQRIHLAAIFERASNAGKDLPRSNYREMRKFIQGYYWKRHLVRMLKVMGLKR